MSCWQGMLAALFENGGEYIARTFKSQSGTNTESSSSLDCSGDLPLDCEGDYWLGLFAICHLAGSSLRCLSHGILVVSDMAALASR